MKGRLIAWAAPFNTFGLSFQETVCPLVHSLVFRYSVQTFCLFLNWPIMFEEQPVQNLPSKFIQRSRSQSIVQPKLNVLLLQQKHAIVPIQQNMLLFSCNLLSSVGFLNRLTRE